MLRPAPATPLPVTRWDNLADGVLNYHFARSFLPDITAIHAIWKDGHIGKLVSQGGSPAYCFAMAAKGAHASFVMGYKRVAPDPWDMASGTLLVQNAGGLVTDLAGEPIDPLTHRSYVVASSHPGVHSQTLSLLNQYGLGAHRVKIFHDATDKDAHDKFQQWRHEHEDGFFINCHSDNAGMMHRTPCSHMEFTEKVSLTSRQKVCSSSKTELDQWARGKGFKLAACSSCAPD